YLVFLVDCAPLRSSLFPYTTLFRSFPRLRRENVARDVFAPHCALAIIEEEEKCLVADDGSAHTGSKLVLIGVFLFFTTKVRKERVCIEGAVMVCPKHAASNLVRSRARHHLHLADAPAALRIRRRDDGAHFFNQVGAGKRCGIYAV